MSTVLRILLTSLLFILPCLSTPEPTLRPQQDAETRTVDGLTSSVELKGGLLQSYHRLLPLTASRPLLHQYNWPTRLV